MDAKAYNKSRKALLQRVLHARNLLRERELIKLPAHSLRYKGYESIRWEISMLLMFCTPTELPGLQPGYLRASKRPRSAPCSPTHLTAAC